MYGYEWTEEYGIFRLTKDAKIQKEIRPVFKEELDFFQNEQGIELNPNIVTDVYKVRSGEWNQVRIWSDVNLGNLRKTDLFVTDARMNVLEVGGMYNYIVSFEDEQFGELAAELSRINGVNND